MGDADRVDVLVGDTDRVDDSAEGGGPVGPSESSDTFLGALSAEDASRRGDSKLRAELRVTIRSGVTDPMVSDQLPCP